MEKGGYFCVVCSENKENVFRACREGPKPTLYKFPESPSRREKWISILNLSGRKLVARAKVCERHFTSDQFIRTQLKNTALPSSVIVHKTKSDETTDSKGLGKTRPPLVKILPKEQSINIPVLIASQIIIQQQVQELQPFSTDCSTETSSSTPPTPVFSHRKCRKKISKLSNELQELQLKSKNMIEVETVFKQNPGFKLIVQSQIMRYQNKFSPYNTFEKTLALSLYYSCGRSGYRTLLSLGFLLPAMSSIRRWMCEFKFTTGINPQLFEILATIFQNKSGKDLDCVLLWDEMSSKELVEYNKWLDVFEGIVDFGHHGRQLDSSNEVLVFMVHGIHSRWKFPLSFYFSNNSTSSEMLFKLLSDNLQQLFKIGLNVRMGICDMSFTNQGLYRLLGISPEVPYYYFENHKVFFVHDTPHLIKLVRNNLMKHQFILKKTVKNTVVKTTVKWSDIVSFFRKDRRTVSRMAPKLTNAHIFPRDYSKMKVKLATQVFSHSVYAGMTAMCRLGIMKKEAKATAQFVREVDGLFDLLNISKYENDKQIRCAKYFFENLPKLERYVTLIKSISLKDVSRNNEFLRGLLLNLNGIKLLALDLKKEGYVCLYTRNLQQDGLENFFSAARMKGGGNRNPTARQFRLNFRYLFFSMVMINPGNGNTENLNRNIFKRISKIEDVLPLGNVPRTPKPNLNDISTKRPVNTKESELFYGIKLKRNLKLGKEQEECVGEYIGTACISTITKASKCNECKKMILIGPSPKLIASALTTAKNYSSQQKLHHLRIDVSTVFKNINSKFPHHALETLNISGCCVAEGILRRYREDIEVNNWLIGEKGCLEHRLLILRYFIRAKLFKLVEDKNDKIKQPKSWEQSRRDLRNQ